MTDGGTRGRNSGKSLESLREALADTGRRLRDGSFTRKPDAKHRDGCVDGRPAFATSPAEGNEAPSGTFTIITPHAVEACAFTDYIYSLFSPFLDECIGQDLSERITQAAVEYSCYVDEKDATALNLLKVIHAEAEAIAEEMTTGEFPYISGEE